MMLYSCIRMATVGVKGLNYSGQCKHLINSLTN